MEQTDWLARCCLFSCAPDSLRLNQCTWKRVSLRRVTVKGYGGVTADKERKMTSQRDATAEGLVGLL